MQSILPIIFKKGVFTKVTLLILALFFISGHNLQAQNGMQFDGIDDYISVPNASGLIAGSSNISVSLWVFPENTSSGWPDFDGFAGFRNEFNADFYLMQLSPNQVEARFRNSFGTNYNIIYNGLTQNTWHHFVLTYNGSTLTLFHNGSSVSSTAASGSISATTVPFEIGKLTFSTTNFILDGKLDNVALWNKTLSPTEVSVLYNNTCAHDLADPNLQLCYEFNQGIAGGNNTGISSLIDSKGNTNGTFVNFSLTGNNSNFVAGVPGASLNRIAVSACGSYTVPSGNMTYTTSGIYIDSLTNVSGCDSLLEIDLTINSPFSGVLDTAVCESYLSPAGNVYTATATYIDSLTASTGCDSVLKINLTVEGTSNDTTTAVVCDSYTSVTGFVYTVSGFFADTLLSSIGCDSVVSVDLTVTEVDTSVMISSDTLTAMSTSATYQWIDCNTNTPILGATDQQFVPDSTGAYAVVLTENECSDTSACVSVMVATNIDQALMGRVSLYPNPSNGQFFIDFTKETELANVYIYSMQGQKVYQTQFHGWGKIDIDMSHETDGIYLVRIESSGSVGTFKMVKRHQP